MAKGIAGSLVIVLVLFSSIPRSSALDEPTPGPPKDEPFQQVEPGIYQLHDVRIDRRRRTVSFPAVLNLSHGAMEYFLVSTWGKVHESILRTEAEPYHIHTAMLLLGAKGMGTNEQDLVAFSGPYVSHPSSVRLPGDKISLLLKWKAQGKEIRKRAEQLVFNNNRKSVLRRGSWVYTGSLLIDESFLAQREGSIVSLVTDPEALINNTGPGHDNDTIWTPNTKNLPPTNTPVEVIIQLAEKPR